jgi:hypothetical protein
LAKDSNNGGAISSLNFHGVATCSRTKKRTGALLILVRPSSAHEGAHTLRKSHTMPITFLVQVLMTVFAVVLPFSLAHDGTSMFVDLLVTLRKLQYEGGVTNERCNSKHS